MMPVFFIIIRKEFQQIFRNRTMIPLLTVMPLVQLIVLSFAADYEVRNIRMSVVDTDKSQASRALVQKFTASGYFTVSEIPFSLKEAMLGMEKGEADIILSMPSGFGRDLSAGIPSQAQLLINAVNSQKAGIAGNYSARVIALFNRDLAQKFGAAPAVQSSLNISEGYWYNPQLNYKTFMVPGILAVLVTMLAAFLSSINIIREKELGTIEQLNVTPMRKSEFILGKLVPFWMLGMFMLGFGLLLSRLLFGIRVEGSILLLFSFCAIYLCVILGMGMLISTRTETQQQSMFLTWFFFVIFILLSGLFTPIDSIPQWAKIFNILNPLQYFVKVMRLVMLKGSGWAEVREYFLIVSGYAVVYFGLAVFSYRKRSA